MLQKIDIKTGTNLNNLIAEFNSQDQQLSELTDYYFEDWIYDELPSQIIKLFTELNSPQKKDTALLSILQILSAIIKNYEVEYDDKFENCQLYVYILGDPAQGKGAVEKYSQTGISFHSELLKRYEDLKRVYKENLQYWEANDKQGAKPIPPNRQVLFIAGNNSKAALLKDLKENSGYGAIFETEADAIAIANKSDFGNFTDVLRQGFHSERLLVNRVSFEDGAIEIPKVILSVLLTSTLDQCFSLMPTYDNGLFSRFIFYILPKSLEFRNVFEKRGIKKLYYEINRIGELYKSIGIENLNDERKIFSYTNEQENRFIDFFKFLNECCVNNNKIQLKASINRLGLIFTRLCMLLSYLRTYEHIKSNNNFKNEILEITCSERDFEITLSMIQTLMCHLLVVDNLYQTKNPKQTNNFFIHSTSKNSSSGETLKKEAVRLHNQGFSYSEIAKVILSDAKKKGTIFKWVKKSISLPVSETETSSLINVLDKLKNTEVSFFDHVKTSISSEQFNLYDLLTTDLFKEKVLEVRSAKGEKAKHLKLSLPAFTASGKFNLHRKKESLVKHSGFICIDIDKKQNEHIKNFSELKSELQKVVNIAYVSQSVSGEGFFALIPIENTSS